MRTCVDYCTCEGIVSFVNNNVMVFRAHDAGVARIFFGVKLHVARKDAWLSGQVIDYINQLLAFSCPHERARQRR